MESSSLRCLGALLAIAAAIAMVRLASASTLDVEIRPVFNGEPLLLDSLRYQTAAGETISVTRLSYLLSGFALERADGARVEIPDTFAWMDAAQRRTTVRLDNVPAGQYRAFSFHVGPDAAANAADPAKWPAAHPLNSNVNGLHWGWQGGYIFLAVEGHYRATGAAGEGYAFHLARDPNRTSVNLAAPLDLRHNSGVVTEFDLAVLFNAPRPVSIVRDGSATHSRDGDSVAGDLATNLRGAFRLQKVIAAAPAISLPSVIKPLYLPQKFTPYRLVINRTFPIPDLPRDNPLIEERVTLGRRLFHENALSRDGSISCASCHQENAGLSDPRRFSIGVRGEAGTRHAMPLFNLAWKSSYFWDGRAASLREQVLVPIQDHAEMDANLGAIVAKLTQNADYPPLFNAAFGKPEITVEKLGLALENYLLTLTTHEAKFDRALRGQATFTRDERRGFELFMTEYEPRTGQRGADCFHCHGGPLFTDNQFHNNGISKVQRDETGRFRVTAAKGDEGKFATPSLRNVALRPPYMHDGRFSTLEDVVAHYDHGVERSPTLDPNLAKHPWGGLQLSADDRDALVAFLKTLSDG